MTNFVQSENRRRHFLRLGVSVASGIVLPVGFNACSREEGDKKTNKSLQTFVQPMMLEAKNGLLDVTLTVSYLDTKLSGANPNQQFPVSLRAYGYDNQTPSYSGPTLVIRGGDQLRIKLVNNLPVNPPFVAFRDPTNYMKPNTTNLHTHGLHVFPGIYADKKDAEYGDYVVDPNYGGVIPQGDKRQYVYNLPKNHSAGPFYYHPQYHGSSAIQAASLMAGAILVRGAIDELPEMAQATELVFLFQAPYFANSKAPNNYGVKEGLLEKFAQIANHPTGHGLSHSNDYINAQPVLINGVRQPTIVMQSGEIQRWRLINTQVFNYLNLNLDDHIFHQYTTDGWGSSTYQEFPDARQKDNRGLLLAAGNRSSVIVKAGRPGTYLLRSLPVKITQGNNPIILPGDILAIVIVAEAKKAGAPRTSTPIATTIPAAPLPVTDYLKPITDEEFANAGGKKRSVIFNMTGNEIKQNADSSFSAWNNAMNSLTGMSSDALESFKKNTAKAKDDLSKLIGRPIEGSVYIAPNPVPKYEYELQASNTLIQNIILGDVEEWTIFNCNNLSHVFHIHINPMFITRINGASIKPYWCDTVALPAGGTTLEPKSITFRMRFDDFTGPYVMHCQMLQHSDLGMIQRVTVVPV
jgi:FtsP/CotA-like multicopper oxidase with cupredoxin domain